MATRSSSARRRARSDCWPWTRTPSASCIAGAAQSRACIASRGWAISLAAPTACSMCGQAIAYYPGQRKPTRRTRLRLRGWSCRITACLSAVQQSCSCGASQTCCFHTRGCLGGDILRLQAYCSELAPPPPEPEYDDEMPAPIAIVDLSTENDSRLDELPVRAPRAQPTAPSAVAHYLGPAVSEPAAVYYAPPPDQAALQLRAVLGFSSRGRHNFVWHPSSGLFAFSSGSTVVIDDLDSRQQRHLARHLSEISTIAASPDGSRLYSAAVPCQATDGLAQIVSWHAPTGHIMATASYHASPVQALAVAPGGRYVVSVGNFLDPSVALWTADLVLLASSQSDYPVHALEWIDAGTFATAGGEGTLLVWDANEAALDCRPLPLPSALGARPALTAMAVGPDSRLYVGDASGALSVWDPAQQRCCISWKIEDREITAISVGGDRIVTASGTALRRWRVEGGTEESLALLDEIAIEGIATYAIFDAVLALGLVSTTHGAVWYVDWAEAATIRLVGGHAGQVGRQAREDSQHWMLAC
eukprot:m.104130 g.104130  ORF g.104130 m.104130 type:complete len:531 (+) comp8875_c0_seq3:2485-4077(+)